MSVHWLGSAEALVFSTTTYRGSPLPPVNFEMLSRALKQVVAHAKDLSLRTTKWFGVS